ncbi:NK-tumor recognition protein isoform X1 [Anarrhichthys ocellatus]|uniref:NK-tumor recognition protein isoform X1 n=3 Tax=Anarrhichthys ocellatus TaxID=433405 RepID=UPI0012EE1B31|nr:NK-tumor recognition protein isoform X1 [Anarrhichthys ocellatus]XP_031705798.1 NK-tumor recognition protein isoform X1 [Anarrhichthys ocellatus]
MGVKDRPQCYFDVELNREPVGRIVFQLFSDVCPKTSKNFLCLCTGERGAGKITGKKLCYKGSTFHRVVKNFMVQGGDFTEGNGRGGESIYGGYFEDENFILKHDRAFLLSMANRGKDTNGSQFFITTKTAPHLDGVHVVFGLIISGFEVIKKVEGLKTDSASRPYADVRVMDCGQLITKSANDVLGGKRKRTSHSADSSLNSHDSSSPFSSSVGSESESDEKYKHRKHKRHAKSKRSKKKRRESKKENIDVLPAKQSSHSPVEREMLEGDGEVEAEKEQSGRREKPVVRPEEIPPVPENRFLLRRDMPSQEDKTEIVENEETSVSTDPKPAVSKSGRKIKGRGTMRYHTPTRSKSRSASVEERGSSETPPHWKEEMKRTKVYQPPSIERWSKGDKLNDHSSSRWEDRSDSAWSRSAEHSSDRSSERSSLLRQQTKEKKKAKHKKKAKKRKRGKKKSSESKPQEPFPSVGERPVSSERKSGRSRSKTRSSSNQHNSSTRRRRRSSPSFRDSPSYSRSYTTSQSRSRGRSRSYSRPRSLSRSRGRSLSRSRSQSYSPSRSRSRSKYRSRSLSPPRKKSLSRSPRKRKASKHKADSMMSEKLPESKVPPVPRLPSVPAPESAPEIPMSDSPPPSRWKPDQKPWKPSYIHIQEIKAKVAPSSSAGQTMRTEKAQTPTTPKCLPGDSESHKPAGRPFSRSSRSKSYSRSYSHSRSRSYSRSRSRSPHKYKSRSSSDSRSDTENFQKTCSNKKSSLDKEWKEYYSSLRRIKNVDKYISLHSSQDAQPGSEKRPSCEPDISDSRRSSSLEKIKESGGSQDQETKQCSSMLAEPFNSRSEWDSDSDKVSQSNSANQSKKQKQAVQSNEFLDKKLSALTGWNSESDCENVTARTLAISEKEEGEASSESENETSRKTSEAAVALAHGVAAASGQPEESPEKASEPEKHKSKKKAKRKHKRKRRSENKSGSRHSKDKGKRSKRKHQRLKETFHWQPPLEFGEEEEEDELKREKPSPGRVVKERPGVGSLNEKCTSSNKIPKTERERAQHKAKECINKNPKHTELQLQSSKRNGANLPSFKEEESLDDMDICTPEHDAEIVEHPATQDLYKNELTLKSTSRSSDVASRESALPHSKEQPSVPSTATAGGLQDEAAAGRPAGTVANFKWRPLKGTSALQNTSVPPVATKHVQIQEALNAQGVRMEIKSKSRVRPGSLFDEVRKTARLNQRPRNQESSSEERSPSVGNTRSPKKSRSASRHRSRSRGWSHSYSRSRTRSRSSSYFSRSRSRSRRRRGRERSRSRSSTYRSYGSHSRTSSRSHSRSRSYNHRRRRSRSDSYDSYSSRSRSASRRRGRRRSDSYRSSDRRSRSYRSSSRSSSSSRYS